MTDFDPDAHNGTPTGTQPAAGSGASGVDLTALGESATSFTERLGQLSPEQLTAIQEDLDLNVPDVGRDTIFDIDDAAYIALHMRGTNPELWAFIEARLNAAHERCGRGDQQAASARFWLLMAIIARLTGRSKSVAGLTQAANSLGSNHPALLKVLGSPLWSEINTRRKKVSKKGEPERYENRHAQRRRLRRPVQHEEHHFKPIKGHLDDAWDESIPWEDLEQLGLHIPAEIRTLGQVTYGMLIGLTFLQATFCVDDREHRTGSLAIDETKIEAWCDANKKNKPYGDADANWQKRTPTFSDRRKFINGYGAQVGAYATALDRRNKPTHGQPPLISGMYTFTGKMQHPVTQAAPAVGLLHAFHARENLPAINQLNFDKGYTQKRPEDLYRGLHQHGIEILHRHYPWMDKRIAIGDSGYSYEHGRLYRDTMFPQLRKKRLDKLASPETGKTKKIEIEERLRHREIDTEHEPGTPEHEQAIADLEHELVQLEQRLTDLNTAHADAADLAFQFSHYQYDTADYGTRTVKALTFNGPHKARVAYCPNHKPTNNDTPILKNGEPLPQTGCQPQRRCPHRTRNQCLANGGCYHRPHPNQKLLGPTNPDDCATEHGHCTHTQPECWRDHACNCDGTFTLPLVNPIEQINARTRTERHHARNAVPVYDDTTEQWHIDHTDPATGKNTKIKTDSPIIERIMSRTTYGSRHWLKQEAERNRAEGTFGMAKGTIGRGLKRGGIKQRGTGSCGIFTLADIVRNQIIILINNRVDNELPRLPWTNYRAIKLVNRAQQGSRQIDETTARILLNTANTQHETPTEKRQRDTGPPDPGQEAASPDAGTPDN